MDKTLKWPFKPLILLMHENSMKGVKVENIQWKWNGVRGPLPYSWYFPQYHIFPVRRLPSGRGPSWMGGRPLTTSQWHLIRKSRSSNNPVYYRDQQGQSKSIHSVIWGLANWYCCECSLVSVAHGDSVTKWDFSSNKTFSCNLSQQAM